jgi:hypothetical protein
MIEFGESFWSGWGASGPKEYTEAYEAGSVATTAYET